MKIDKREDVVYNKYVGTGEVKVLAFNPTTEQLDALLEREAKEDREEIEYLKADVPVKYKKDGEELETTATRLFVDVWTEEKTTQTKTKTRFMLTDFPATNADGTKNQYINCIGQTTWIPIGDEDSLPLWFTHWTKKDKASGEETHFPKDFRIAKRGEAELYDFITKWTNISVWDSTQSVFLDNNKKFWKGNMSELNSLIPIFEDQTVLQQFGVRTTTKTDEAGNEVTSEYQSVFTRAFCQGSMMNKFNFHKRTKFASLKDDKTVYNLKKFVEAVTSEEYGFKDFTVLDNFQVYDASANPLNSEKAVIEETSVSY